MDYLDDNITKLIIISNYCKFDSYMEESFDNIMKCKNKLLAEQPANDIEQLYQLASKYRRNKITTEDYLDEIRKIKGRLCSHYVSSKENILATYLNNTIKRLKKCIIIENKCKYINYKFEENIEERPNDEGDKYDEDLGFYWAPTKTWIYMRNYKLIFVLHDVPYECDDFYNKIMAEIEDTSFENHFNLLFDELIE